MKRIAALLLCFLLLVGCRSRAASFVPKATGFSCIADVETEAIAFSCSLAVTENGGLTAVLLPPCGYEGLTVTVSNNETKIAYQEQTAVYPNDRLPRGFFAGAVAELLNAAHGGPFTETENGFTVRGVSSRGDYSFSFADDGFPALLTLPQKGLTITFRDFQNLSKND